MEKLYTFFSFLAIFLSTGISNQSAASIFNRKIDSIKIVFDKNQLVLPGESFNIGVISYHKNGKTLKTIGMKDGSIFWWRYNTEVIGGKNSSGKITVNKQLIPSKGKYIQIKVAPRKKPQLAPTILIPLNYETNISFRPLEYFDKAPGCTFKGEIIAEFNNGRTRKYLSSRRQLGFENYQIYTSGIHQNKKGFMIETDFTKIIDHQVDLYVISRRNPEVTNTFSVLLDYKHAYNLAFYGSSGSDGFSGLSGSSGSSGCDGSNGQHGEDGENGYHGPDIGVWTDSYYDSILACDLLYVFAQNFQSGEEYKYLINPVGGNLKVLSRGGSGGDGGRGGDGGDGGRGADGEIWYETITKKRVVSKPFQETITKQVKKTITNSEGEQEEIEETITETITVYRDVEETYTETIKHQNPGEDGGNGGPGGSGGFAGMGGFGGDIYLYFTNDALDYENKIIAKSEGGSGGFGGSSGNGGSGGRGGSGDPNGNSGNCGSSGFSGFDGSSGGEGWIFRELTEDFFHYETLATTQVRTTQK